MNHDCVLSATYAYVDCLQAWFACGSEKSPLDFRLFAEKQGIHLENYSVSRRVPIDVLAKLWVAAEQSFGRPQLALEAAQCRPAGIFGIPEFLLTSSRSVADGLRYFNDYSRLVHDGLVCHFETRNARSVVELGFPKGHHPFNRYAIEILLGMLCGKSSQFLIGRPFKIRALNIEQAAPEHLELYSNFFKAPATLAPKGFVLEFDEDLTQALVLGGNPDVLATLEYSAKTELSLLSNPMNLVDRVIQELLKQMQTSSDFYVSSVAKSLGYTVRSLQRHLQNYGTEYSAILDFFRKENSQFFLLEGKYSVKEIAGILGFTNLASFYRAYKRWHGRAPKSGAELLRAGLGPRLVREVTSMSLFERSKRLSV